MFPVEAHGVRLMSTGFLVPEDEPVIWRGPMLHKALEQFLADVHWGDLDVLLMDLPPGTGDITLSLLELVPSAALLAVTTPQPAARTVASRVGRMAKDARMPIAGVVENMSSRSARPAATGRRCSAPAAGSSSPTSWAHRCSPRCRSTSRCGWPGTTACRWCAGIRPRRPRRCCVSSPLTCRRCGAAWSGCRSRSASPECRAKEALGYPFNRSCAGQRSAKAFAPAGGPASVACRGCPVAVAGPWGPGG